MTADIKTFTIDVILSNFPEQCFRDALKFHKEGKTSNEDVTQKWSSFSACIVFSALCMESYLSSRIREIVRNSIQEDNSIENSEKTIFIDSVYATINDDNQGFQKKITYLKNMLNFNSLPTYHGKIERCDPRFHKIRKVILLRNHIIHYSRDTIFNDLNKENSEDAVKSCKNLMNILEDAKVIPNQPHWIK
jgi:hypothetical protein